MKEGETLFLFGHNPGISYAATALRGTDTPMPTCAVAVFDLEPEDNEIMATAADYIIPKELS